MKSTPLQLTMRELQAALRSPLLWTALAGTSVVLGLVGPFGTYEAFRLPARLAYWSVVVVTTYLAGFATITFLQELLFGRRPGPTGYALLGALAGPVGAAVVWAINWAVFDGEPGRAIGFLPLVLYTTAIAAVASALIAYFSIRLAPADVATPARPEPPPLLARLPLHLRGALSHLSMQDHYVEVHTDRGMHLVLMRLGDAIAETRGVPGLQIHRSHWVATDAVARTARRNDRLHLVLKNGTELPVSRNYLQAVREAGLA